MIRKLFALLAAALMAAAAPLKAEEINFGIISTEKAGALRQMWEPFLDDMRKSTGIKVNAFYATDYTGIIEAMRFNKVQLAWFGNKSAIEAVDRASGEVFAQFIDLDGTPGYYSYLITHRDSAVRSLDDMLKNAKSLSFGIGDPQSTSGTLVPTYYVFTQNNLEPKEIFKVVRSANHEANLLAVLNKQVDVATNNSEQLTKLKATSPEKHEQVRILWTSPLIPRDPLVWRTDISPDAKVKIRAFVTSYGRDAREKEILKNMYRLAGFKESSNAQLLPIRQLELFKDRKKIEADAAMNPQERAAKLAEIDARLAELSRQLQAAK